MGLVAQTDSRIANASRTWQAACNIDITGWDKANEFIIATYALSDSVNPDSGCKLQWRRAGGSFADVAADTEICWGTGTVLVDAAVLVAAAGCLSTVDDGVENEGDNLAYLLNIKNGGYGEIHWALGFGSGAQDDQEYELQFVVVDFSSTAVLQTTITTAVGSVPIDVTATLDELILTEYDVTVNAELNIQVGIDELILTEYNATVNAELSIQAGIDELVLTEYNAVVSFVLVIDVQAGVDELILTEYNPTVNAEKSISAGIDELVLTKYNAVVSLDRSFTAGIDELILTEYNVTVNKELTIQAGLDTLILTEYDADVVLGAIHTASINFFGAIL